MLVLSRKVGERIVIPGCDLTITVVKVSGNKVRLGMSAPDGVVIHREEVWLRDTWASEDKQSAQSSRSRQPVPSPR